MSDKRIKLGIRNSLEQNKKVLEAATWNADSVKKMRESLLRSTKIDIRNADKFPVMKEGFCFRAMEEKLQEADAATSFPQLLRAGVQTIVNNMYQTVPTTFEEWAHVLQSDKEEELYAPLQGIGFPREVGRQEKYPESGAAGLDMKLRNRKYGEIFPVEAELLMNDQTGQVKNMVGVMAEYAKLVVEVIVYAKLGSVANSAYAGLSVPVSETKPSTEATYPWARGLVGGGNTKGAAPAAFTAANFQTARLGMLAQLNLLGIKMAVMPKRLIISPQFELDASTILNSNYYPVGAGAAGAIGGAFANNFLKGIAQLTVAPYMFDNAGAITGLSKAWYLADDSKAAFVVQMREPGKVTQENPESGESFERDIVRWKLSVHCNADFIDPRFFWQGSDGSV